ncbi:hypothetical protein DL89DRAFT_285748 [Linderina pennispora]|uniref:MFS general substrate transporter n=1 Tax=Linderina pennispora TaxID=61395 RepID=A0A1Y1W0P5_9FUNG|nr:uncharacterized protein DL89DRAFT_285748 [Linderina pennispora]ORX67077.1 hypothetical protein DL89DRAFT_285748 [Linderina pennispora]
MPMQDSAATESMVLMNAAQAANKHILPNDRTAGDSISESDSVGEWLVTAASFIYTMISMGTAASSGVYMDEYLTKEFPGTLSSTLAWISTMQIGLTFFCGIIFGPMMERTDIRIVGIAISGSAVGGIWQSFAMRAIIKSHRHRWALRISDLIQIALCGSATLPMKRRIEAPPRRRSVDYAILGDIRFIMLFLFGITVTAGVFGRLLPGVLAACIGPINTSIIFSSLATFALFEQSCCNEDCSTLEGQSESEFSVAA